MLLALTVPALVLLQVASGSSRKANSSMHMNMDLQSAMKCQASFLRQILQPAVVDKVCLRVSTILAAVQMGQSEQHTALKYRMIHGMHLPPGSLCVANCPIQGYIPKSLSPAAICQESTANRHHLASNLHLRWHTTIMHLYMMFRMLHSQSKGGSYVAMLHCYLGLWRPQ